MNEEDVEIIDIRRYSGSNTRILSYEDGEIIFSKENKSTKKHYCSLNRYKVKTDTIEEIFKYEIPESEFYSQYIHVIREDIIIIKMHDASRIEVAVLDRVSKKLKSEHYFEVKEEVTSAPIIVNARYFMFYTDNDKINTQEYIQYKEKGYWHFLYLCDLLEEQIYLIKDLRLGKGLSIVHGLLGEFPTFTHNYQEYLLFNETYMDDYEYEKYVFDAIKDRKLDKNLVKDIEGLYLIPINDFVESIKEGQKNIPFKEIRKRYLDGWVRYLGIDEKNIYFREKDFNSQIEKIYTINRSELEAKVEKEIDHKHIKGALFYGNIIYEKIELDDQAKIKGIYNCDYNLSFKNDKNLWFEGFISNRYLIISQWIEDKEDNYFEYVHILDTKVNNQTKYNGTCKIYSSDIILYGGSAV